MKRFYAHGAAACTAGAMQIGAASGVSALEGTRCSPLNRLGRDVDDDKGSKAFFTLAVITSRFFSQTLFRWGIMPTERSSSCSSQTFSKEREK